MKFSKKLIFTMLIAMATSTTQALETTIDFENQSVTPPLTSITSLTVGNVTFDGFDDDGAVAGFSITNLNVTPPGETELDFSGQYLFNGILGFSELKISFLNPVSQFSFNLGDNQLPWEIEAFDAKNMSISSLMIDAIPPSSSNNGALFGLSSLDNEGISYATLTQVGKSFVGVDTIEFDNLTYTEVSPIPEPSTYALMLGGLGMVGFMAYRQRKTKNA